MKTFSDKKWTDWLTMNGNIKKVQVKLSLGDQSKGPL